LDLSSIKYIQQTTISIIESEKCSVPYVRLTDALHSSFQALCLPSLQKLHYIICLIKIGKPQKLNSKKWKLWTATQVSNYYVEK